MSLSGFGTHSFDARAPTTTSISLTAPPFSRMYLQETFLQLHLQLILRVSSLTGSIGSLMEYTRDGVALFHPFATHLMQKNTHSTIGRKQYGSR
jgi:hypothetical protein